MYKQSSRQAHAGQEHGQFRIAFFELGGDAGASLATRGTEHRRAPDRHEVLEKPLHPVWVSDGFPGAEVEKSSEEIGEDAGEDVDMEFLVGPVELGTQRDVDGILEVREDGFDISLTAVGVNDVGGGPVVAIGDEDDAAEGVGIEGGECGLIEGVGQSEACF